MPRRRSRMPVSLSMVAVSSALAVLAATTLATAVWAAAVHPVAATTAMTGRTATTSEPTTATTSEPTATPTLPTSATITIEPARFAGKFVPRNVSLAPGGTLQVTNNTTMKHSVTSVAIGTDGTPLFNVVIPPGATRSVPVSALTDGVYDFYCRFHPAMTGSLTIGTGGPVTTVPKFEQPLYQPPRLHGRHLRIVMRKALVRVLPHGPRTPMWTYGGTFPGPTIVRPTGRDTRVTFVNRLPKAAGAVTIHQHGGHQASRYDGQPARYLIRHGQRRTYDWPLRDAGEPIPASLRFYHDHRMMVTARNNWRGLQGMFLTTDPSDAKRGLPTGRYDIPLAVTERSFTKDNRLTNPFHHAMSMTDPPSGTVGSQVLVNGRFAPYKRVRPGIYRIRLLNTSLFSSYDFALSDGRAFQQIGTGSGLLPHAVTRQDILLGPAQRADVLVDFRKLSGKSVLLQSIPRSDGVVGGSGSHVAVLMQFRVRGDKPVQHVHVPDPLGKVEHLRIPRKVAMTWDFGVSKDKHGAYWSINGRRFNPRRVDHRVRLGTVEKWRIHNSSDMTHYVHLHEEEWLTVSRDGRRPPPWERGYEDTWRLDPGEAVVVAAKFTDYTGDFMIHCHMLDHEDDSMMATWRVVK
ncbi:MAG: multicopper oxidase domain-containing protein [Nocardioides sp.]|nr:multicopper oxidase domain-containing protein [Nocardioides sp.]